MGLARKASGAPPAAPPDPGGWPGGSWGIVWAADGSGHAVADEDVLIEISDDPGPYDPGNTFTNNLGGTSAFGRVTGSGPSFGLENSLGTDPRWLGRWNFTTSADWRHYRISVPAAGDYRFYWAMGRQHGGYLVDIEVNADGGVWDRWVDSVSGTNVDPTGVGHFNDTTWGDAEATNTRVLTNVAAFIEFRGRCNNGSAFTMASIRLTQE